MNSILQLYEDKEPSENYPEYLELIKTVCDQLHWTVGNEQDICVFITKILDEIILVQQNHLKNQSNFPLSFCNSSTYSDYCQKCNNQSYDISTDVQLNMRSQEKNLQKGLDRLFIEEIINDCMPGL